MKIAVLFRGNLRNEDRTYEKFDLVYRSVKKLFYKREVDYYMHLWGNEDDKKRYGNNFNFKKILVEENSKYEHIIHSLSIIHGNNVNGTNLEYFNQISQALSIQKVCELIDNEDEYDLIFITRPDLPFSEKMNIPIVDKETIYVNKHGPLITSGDYCFLFSKNNLHVFKDIFKFLKETKTKPACHIWFNNYFTNFCKKNVGLINVEVMVNCEIFKHLENQPSYSDNMGFLPVSEIYKHTINFVENYEE